MITSSEYLTLAIGLILPVGVYLYFLVMARPARTKVKLPESTAGPSLPQKISPSLAGLYLDGKVGIPEFSAAIVYLLVEGFLSIVDKGESIVFLKQKPFSNLEQFELSVANALLAKGSIAKTELEIVRVINRRLYDKNISGAIRSLYRQGVERRIFFEDPSARYAWYYLVGLIFFLLGPVVLIWLWRDIFQTPTLLFIPAGLSLSGTIIIDRAKHIQAFSATGRKERQQWQLYQEQLRRFRPGDEWGKDPQRDISLRLLPYAFAFQAESDWFNNFSGHAFAPPEWFLTFKINTREEFISRLQKIVHALAADLFSLREPALIG